MLTVGCIKSQRKYTIKRKRKEDKRYSQELTQVLIGITIEKDNER